MLWYKAWLETRLRFLICLAGITGLCSYNVFQMDYRLPSPVNLAYYYATLHFTNSRLAIIWLLAINFITMGGLLREKAVGAASFTLALPFSRARLTGVRIAVSVTEAAALLVIPWIAMFVVDGTVGKAHSIPQALFHLVLLTGGGMLPYAIALLASSIVEGEYMAPIVSFGVIVVISLNLDSPGLRQYNPMNLMTGGKYYDAHAGLLIGSVPWLQISIYALLAAVLVAASVKAIQMREF